MRRGLVDDFLAAAEVAGETDDAELRGALILLSRFEADVAERLRLLARDAAIAPQRAVRLEALAATVEEARPPSPADVVRNFLKVEDGYVRVPELLDRGDSTA